MKSWGDSKKVNKQLQPGLLGQGTIPKPLHGINPRTIMGASAWSKLRVNIINDSPYCKACGKDTLVLDLHEDYAINYVEGSLILKQYVPLCKTCHSFIHSGLLTVLISNSDISIFKGQQIIQHGLNICRDNKIKVFYHTMALAEKLKVSTTGISSWTPPPSYKAWTDWYLEYEGAKHKGMSKKAWEGRYR
jgi:hypothetical protein